MLNSLVVKSHPKINLSLDVVGKREDGYHNLKMIMQSLKMYDTVSLEKKGSSIKITTNLSFLPTDSKNIAYKAAELFFNEFNINDRGITINLDKKIPVCAGLAGGSSNAAAVLKALVKMYDVECTDDKLMQLGLKLGADVPYCLYGGLALAEGVGDILTPLSGIEKSWICLAKPDVFVSTAEVFKSINLKNIIHHPDTNGIISSINNNDIKGVALRLYNVLEQITGKKYKIIRQIESKMLDYGALGAVMSGSGPSVFGIFQNENDARNCCEKLKSVVDFSVVTETIV